MSQCGRCMSPQEERVVNKSVDRKGRERVYGILEQNQFSLPHVDVERAKYFTESMRETEGELLTLRWAKALKNVAEKITVYITPNQLIAGRVGKFGRYGILYPEIDGDFYREVLADLEHRDKSPFQISQEDIKVVMEEIAPYWEGKTYHEHLNKTLPAEIRSVTYVDERGLKSKFVVSETSSYRSALQWVPDYEKVIKRGFLDIQKEAREKLATLDLTNSVDLWDKKPFLEAMIIVCDSIMIWAKRHADLARELAAKEGDSKRKAELLHLELPDDVVEYIANNLKNNIRQLEGAVKKMNAYYMLEGISPVIGVAQNAIRDILSETQPVPLTVERIISEVARTYNVTASDIRGPKRNSAVSAARRTAAYVVREITGLSMEEIGKEFGGRDHSTIVYSIRVMEKDIQNDSRLKETVEDIIKNVRS